MNFYIKQKSAFLYFSPILILILIICIDRLFTIQSIRRLTETRAEYYFYQIREKLIPANVKEQKENPNQSTLFILGTSHLGELSTEVMEKSRPDLLPYNYSTPSAPFSYYYYIFSKAIDKGVTPKYLVLEVFPFSATKEANFYALRYSYDWNFFRREFYHFDWNEKDTFLRSQFFETQKFPFRLSEAIKRFKDPSQAQIFEMLRDRIENDYKKNRGGIANDLIHNIPPEKLQLESESYYRSTLANLQFSEDQFYFLEQVFKKAEEHKIPILVVETIQYPALYELIQNAPFQIVWNFRMSLFKNKYKFTYLKFQEYEKELDCKYFIDSHHLSGKCYEKPTEILMKNLPQIP